MLVGGRFRNRDGSVLVQAGGSFLGPVLFFGVVLGVGRKKTHHEGKGFIPRSFVEELEGVPFVGVGDVGPSYVVYDNVGKLGRFESRKDLLNVRRVVIVPPLPDQPAVVSVLFQERK